MTEPNVAAKLDVSGLTPVGSSVAAMADTAAKDVAHFGALVS